MKYWFLFGGLLIGLLFIPTMAYGQGTGLNTIEECSEKLGKECQCWEVGSCNFASDPLGTMQMPFDSIFGGLSLVILWSLVLGIIWLRTQNPMLCGLLGVAMTGAYLATGDTPTAEFKQAQAIGVALFLTSVGISLYHLINSRLHAPPQ